MINRLSMLLLALLLVSFAPAPAQLQRAIVAPARLRTTVLPRSDRAGARMALSSRPAPETARQACSYELATARLRQQISDPIGYPFGFVEAFSCAGDALTVAQELAARAAAMREEASAYRDAHPIRGLRP